MSLDHESVLEKEFEEMKSIVNEHEHELEELIKKEKKKEDGARENVIRWLEGKKKRKELMEDEETIRELLSHIEHAYRTASIPEDTYAKAKSLHKELLDKS